MFYTPSSRIGQNIMRIELLDTYGILRIKTTEFLFDLEDLPLIKGRDSWYCDKDGYLVSSYFYNGVRRFVRFHRLVMHAKPGQCVDHINKNKADNRKKTCGVASVLRTTETAACIRAIRLVSLASTSTNNVRSGLPALLITIRKFTWAGTRSRKKQSWLG